MFRRVISRRTRNGMDCSMARAIWAGVFAVALLWPSHALSMFDGLPLDGRAEAILIGVAVPVLWWLRSQFFDNAFARAAVVALLVVRIAGTVLLTQQGLCARFSTAAPYST